MDLTVALYLFDRELRLNIGVADGVPFGLTTRTETATCGCVVYTMVGGLWGPFFAAKYTDASRCKNRQPKGVA